MTFQEKTQKKMKKREKQQMCVMPKLRHLRKKQVKKKQSQSH